MVRRKSRRTRRSEYTEEHIRVLLEGSALILQEVPDFVRGSSADREYDFEAIREAWESLRDELLPEYVDQTPGQRPAAWWLFDAPEPRRRIVAGYDPDDDPDDARRAWMRRLLFGVYTVWGRKDLADPPTWETQAAFLNRHGLLTDAEREALGDDYPKTERPTEERFGRTS